MPYPEAAQLLHWLLGLRLVCSRTVGLFCKWCHAVIMGFPWVLRLYYALRSLLQGQACSELKYSCAHCFLTLPSCCACVSLSRCSAFASCAAVEPPNNQDGTQPAAPARRRRKPLVSSPAPTDMCVVVSSGKGCSALPAPLAALDVLPPPPPPVVTAERPLGASDGGIAACTAGAAAVGGVSGVDAAEAEAVAALADMPSPRAAGYHSQQLLLHHRHRQGQLAVEEESEFAALEEEEAGEGEGEDDGDDDYAPPVRRQPLALAAEHSGSIRRWVDGRVDGSWVAGGGVFGVPTLCWAGGTKSIKSKSSALR